MRIVVTGAEHPSAQRFIARMALGNEIFGISEQHGLDLGVPVFPGAARDLAGLIGFLPGAEVVVHASRRFVPEDLLALSAAAQGSRVRRIVALACGDLPAPIEISAWPGPVPVLLAAALPIGADDVLGVEAALRDWATQHRAGPGEVDLVDLADVDGAVETALSRGRPGALYPLCGPRLRWEALQALILGGAPPPVAGEEHPLFRGDATLDDAPSRAELGWWHRDPSRSLRGLRRSTAGAGR